MSERYENATPGPWTVAGGSLSLMGNVVSIEIIDADGFTIADLPTEPLLSGWREKHPHLQHWGEDVLLTQRKRSEAELQANTALLLDAPTLAADIARYRSLIEELVGALGASLHEMEHAYGGAQNYAVMTKQKVRTALTRAKQEGFGS